MAHGEVIRRRARKLRSGGVGCAVLACLQKFYETSDSRWVDAIGGRRPFEKVMVTDQVDYQTRASHSLARLSIRYPPVNRGVANSQASRTLLVVRVRSPRADLKSLMHLYLAMEGS